MTIKDWTAGPDGAGHVDTVARTLWGEARGESLQGQIAVAWVIRNRADIDLGNDGKPDWWGETPTGVCHAKRQFSCWEDAQAPKLKALTVMSPGFPTALSVARKVLAGITPDPTNGGVNYHTIADPGEKVRGTHGWPPEWAAQMEVTAHVGAHVFYREKRKA